MRAKLYNGSPMVVKQSAARVVHAHNVAAASSLPQYLEWMQLDTVLKSQISCLVKHAFQRGDRRQTRREEEERK